MPKCDITLIQCLLLLSGCSPFVSPEFREATTKRLIVALEAQNVEPLSANEIPETIVPNGAGIIIGADKHSVFVATAHHVIEPRVDRGKTAPAPCQQLSAANETICRRFLLKTRLSSKGPILAFPVSDQPRLWEGDYDVLRFARDELRGTTFDWRALASSEPPVASTLQVVGGSHGLDGSSSAHVSLVNARAPGPDEITLGRTAVSPAPGDSGGALLTLDWGLVGLYRGAADSKKAYRIDSMLERIATATHPPVPIDLETERTEPSILGYLLGGAAVVAGIGALVVGHAIRGGYYADPDAYRSPPPMAAVSTITGDALLLVGAGVLVYELTRRLVLYVDVEHAPATRSAE